LSEALVIPVEPLPPEYVEAAPDAVPLAGECAGCGRPIEQLEVLGLRAPQRCTGCDRPNDVTATALRMQREMRKAAARRVVPPLYRELAATRRDEYPRAAWSEIAAWCPRDAECPVRGHGLLITGPTGTWKSTMAAHKLAQVHVDTGWSIGWLSAPEYETVLRDGWSGDKDAARAARRLRSAAKSARLLVLDDLGKEGATEAIEREIFALLDYRQARMKPTFITLNADPASFRARLSADRRDPLMRRIAGVNRHVDTELT
jgi:DNA replication protein DnaC